MKCRLRVQRHRSSSRTPRAGFTLVEIMVVIGILGIVLAMGVPPFVRLVQKDPLRQAVGDIEEGCNQARARAILQGVPTELVIRAADGQLTVAPVPDTQAGQTAAGAEATEPLADPAASSSTLFSARLHPDIAITLLYVNLKDCMKADKSRVHFYPNGTSDEFTIVLQTDRGVRKISLECVTALPKVEVIR